MHRLSAGWSLKGPVYSFLANCTYNLVYLGGMDSNFETSFIPQQPLLKLEGARARREPINFAVLLALIIFFTVSAVAGGMFAYKASIDARVNKKQNQLDEAENKIDIAGINSLKQISAQVNLAKTLVDKHAAFSGILDLIEAGTAQNIAYTALSFSNEAKAPAIILSGQAPSYMAAYYQGLAWQKQKFVKSATLGGMMIDEKTSLVTFNISLQVDPAAYNYVRLFKDTQVPPALPTTQPASAASPLSPASPINPNSPSN